MKNLLLFISILLFSTEICAKPNVLCTSAPLASMVSMIGDNKIEIKTLQKSHGCIHHFHLKPQDVNMIHRQGIIIYVSDNFESFLSKVKHPNKFPLSKILDKDIQHIWLDIPSVKKSLNAIAEKLSEMHPEYRANFMDNLSISLKKIDELEMQIHKIFEQNKNKIIITSKELRNLLDHLK